MYISDSSTSLRLLSATRFAAEKHGDQRRKGSSALPYINHPIEVAEHLARAGQVTDENILIAALLHDTIEDTETSPEEIEQEFGPTVLALVLECSDDKSLEKAERKRLQILKASSKSDGAKQIKLADKTCNLRSILHDPPSDWSPTRKLKYFQWAEEVIAGLRGVNSQLEAEVDAVLEQGLEALNI